MTQFLILLISFWNKIHLIPIHHQFIGLLTFFLVKALTSMKDNFLPKTYPSSEICYHSFELRWGEMVLLIHQNQYNFIVMKILHFSDFRTTRLITFEFRFILVTFSFHVISQSFSALVRPVIFDFIIVFVLLIFCFWSLPLRLRFHSCLMIYSQIHQQENLFLFFQLLNFFLILTYFVTISLQAISLFTSLSWSIFLYFW